MTIAYTEILLVSQIHENMRYTLGVVLFGNTSGTSIKGKK